MAWSKLGAQMKRSARAVLWTDAGAACVAGIVVLTLRDLLAELYGFSSGFMLFIGAMNLGYASYSGTLVVRSARRITPSRRAIEILAVANIAWSVFCALVLVTRWHAASVLGLLQMALEGAFVGALAVAEWRIVRPNVGLAS